MNSDYPDEDETLSKKISRKLKVDLFIDDRNVGGLPDWGVIYEMINSNKTYEQVLRDMINAPQTGKEALVEILTRQDCVTGHGTSWSFLPVVSCTKDVGKNMF